jgi:hypothetical protein
VFTLPARYAFTIALDTSNTAGNNPQHNVLSATFSGHDENGVPFGSPLTVTLVDQNDLQTNQNVQAGDLSPTYELGFYFVGPVNGEKATLSSGVGAITLTSSGMTAYPGIGGIPPTFNLPNWGTVEDSNAIYTEVPSGSHSTFVQYFRVP